jgi:hypothetical protein
MKFFLEDGLRACQHWRDILEIRLHVVTWLRVELGELRSALRPDMLLEGGEIMNNHHLMNIVRCPIPPEGYCVLHQRAGATGHYRVTPFLVVKIPSLHILAVVATCHLHKE